MRASRYLKLSPGRGVFAAGLALLASCFQLAWAQGDLARWEGEWNGLRMQVAVVTRGHVISDAERQERPWWQWGRTNSDVFLFGFAPGGYDLVLDFGVRVDRPRVRIYVVDQRERGEVRVLAGQYILPAAHKQVIELWPRDENEDWLTRNGLPNFDLEGLVPSDEQEGLIFGLSVAGNPLRPGEPLWHTTRIINDAGADRGYSRFGAAVRSDPSVRFKLADPLLPSFPYLSVVQGFDPFGDDRPMVYELNTHAFRSTWAGFQSAGVYAFNSKSFPPYTDFEAPFAWYRFNTDPLNNPSGKYADLVVRADYWPQQSLFGPDVYRTTRSAFRLSWKGRDPLHWRYSLTVAGNHEMRTRVRVGDEVVLAVPYWDYPAWVATKPWKAATLVEATRGESGSEGIYDYSVEDSLELAYWVNGQRDEPPPGYDRPYIEFPQIHPQRLAEGFRGEYSMVYNRVPELYFSPIDRRVHLKGAQAGIWNLGKGQVLRSYNLEPDDYVDSWVREQVPLQQGPVVIAEHGQPLERLHFLRGFVIYSGPTGVVLRRGEAQLHSLELPVPTDWESWRPWATQLPQIEGGRDPRRLDTWMGNLGGALLQEPGGSLSEVWRTPEGLRLVLQSRGQGRGPLAPDAPGAYVLRYSASDERWSVEPSPPPRLVARIKSRPLRELYPVALELEVENQGGASWSGPAELVALRTNEWGNVEKETLKRWERLELMGQSTVRKEIHWATRFTGTREFVLMLGERKLEVGRLEVAHTPRMTAPPPNPVAAPFALLVLMLGLLGILRVWKEAA
ncbi:hypothetical protein [Calidithermus roseus]|uniref:Uncharacterized protein n=1 Tax=Calidithermus roseus TaxID=1644118 RepID=A0A399EHV0_9DEIN|nr:hypothetical protein [Calidithermus roseus]RIH84227.1 hypothetical protein Mrose_02740 [Calidithermus roseus]